MFFFKLSDFFWRKRKRNNQTRLGYWIWQIFKKKAHCFLLIFLIPYTYLCYKMQVELHKVQSKIVRPRVVIDRIKSTLLLLTFTLIIFFSFSDQLIKQALNNIRNSPCGGNYENLEEILKQVKEDPETLYRNWHICTYGEAPKGSPAIWHFWRILQWTMFWKTTMFLSTSLHGNTDLFE